MMDNFVINQTSFETLNTLMTPSPPAMANISPEFAKSTVKHDLLRSLIYAHGLN
jgi:hypothetical protein